MRTCSALQFVSCTELQDQPYSADLSVVGENLQVHPITKSSSCWLVHPPGAAPTHEPPAPEHHSMALCRDLEPYIKLVAEIEEEDGAGKEDCTEKPQDCSSVSGAQRQHLVFNNTAYYYLYNRLVDFLSSRDIVSHQISQVVKACQPGEVVIRDALYRLGVAQINTEGEVEEGLKQDAVYEVVLAD